MAPLRLSGLLAYGRFGVVEFKRGFPAAVCEYGAGDGQQYE